ncbi:MAG: FmdB family zinc ribbon protein [Deferribacterales bacterium]|jgi:putative FmdB family regulatory protein
MPIYEYACASCGKVTEKLVSMSGDNQTTECECGAMAEKIMSASAFHLKGGGWYSQGYGKDKSCPMKDTKPACSNCPAADV